MSTMSEISALLDEIKSCGNTLISIYDELHNLIDSKEPDEEKPKTKNRKKRTKTEEAPETVLEEQPPEEPPKPLTFEEIQTAWESFFLPRIFSRHLVLRIHIPTLIYTIEYKSAAVTRGTHNLCLTFDHSVLYDQAITKAATSAGQ